MRIHHVQQGLKNALKHLKPITQVTNTFTSIERNQIGWQNRIPGIIKNCYYPFEYQFLLDKHQYSVLLSDSSFFQFYYEFGDAGNLTCCRLAYYPRPLETADSLDQLHAEAENALDREDEHLFDHLYNWIELIEDNKARLSNTAHLRFDYDHSAVTHSPAHIQFSAIQNFRIPADFVPQPLAFVQMCETLLGGIAPLASKKLGFEGNNSLAITKPSQLISLAFRHARK